MFIVIEDGKLPTKGSEYAACVDLFARKNLIIKAGETTLIPLGVRIDLSLLKKMKESDFISEEELNLWIEDFKHSHYLQLMLRSSLSKKLIIANGVGVIDLDYEDEIMIRVHNPIKENALLEDNTINIQQNDRVAQITILEHKVLLFNISTSEKRSGGFGSTGK